MNPGRPLVVAVSLVLAACDGGARLAAVSEAWAGEDTSCARTNDGRLWCWGKNSSMELGDGSTRSRSSPIRPAGAPADVASVTTGVNGTCVIADGALLCAGPGSGGGGDIVSWQPATVLAAQTVVAAPVVQVVLGRGTNCIVKLDASVWCWGFNDHGSLGDGKDQDSGAPVPVSSLESAVALLAPGGDGSTLVLKSDGSVWGWGALAGANLVERWNQDPSVKPYALTPIPVLDADLAPLSGIVAVQGSSLFACGLHADGRIDCWGNLPASAGLERRLVDVAVTIDLGGVPVPTREIAVGEDMLCRLDQDGTVECLGVNDVGQLGDGTREDRFAMAPVIGLPGAVTRIASGAQHVCATLADDTLWCWGANRFGQLGAGDETDRDVPAQVFFSGDE